MTQSADDIFRLTQSTITRQQEEIDSLRRLTRQGESARAIGKTIAPELKVLFPQIEDIAVTEPVFARVTQDESLDTVSVALVRYSSPMSKAQIDKFREYLSARLKLPDVRIVEVSASLLDKPAAQQNKKQVTTSASTE